MYDLEGDKIIISRDVVFEEDTGWDWKNESGKESDRFDWADDTDYVMVPEPEPETDAEVVCGERSNTADSNNQERRTRKPPT